MRLVSLHAAKWILCNGSSFFILLCCSTFHRVGLTYFLDKILQLQFVSYLNFCLWLNSSAGVTVLCVYTILKAKQQSRGRLWQSHMDNWCGDPPSLAAVPPGHLSLGAVQQERPQPRSADSLFGNTAYPWRRWAHKGGRQVNRPKRVEGKDRAWEMCQTQKDQRKGDSFFLMNLLFFLLLPQTTSWTET